MAIAEGMVSTQAVTCPHQWVDDTSVSITVTYENKGVSHDKVTTTKKCVLCGAKYASPIREVEGHSFYQSGNRHDSKKNQHVYDFLCSKCGATDKRIKTCYGPPCDVTYFSRPEEVCVE